MNDEIYLNLDIKSFESTKEEAKKRDIESNGEDADGYLYPDISLVIDNIELQDETIDFSGQMIDTSSGKDFGFASIKFTPELDLIIELIQVYMKKLGKLKTILEATK